ncbi:hypothetical protein, partial [Thermoflexus sp.]|uniref:hypothetical protein n=1 Tax=Thermoflexus sp. TaxID=1969742 RepID=UPI0035E40BEE
LGPPDRAGIGAGVHGARGRCPRCAGFPYKPGHPARFPLADGLFLPFADSSAVSLPAADGMATPATLLHA